MSIPRRVGIRPVILAGGLGTRLRPRTLHLPKPLLPIAGRPILWYTILSASSRRMLQPIVTLNYKAELIQAYFENANAEFRVLPGRSMIKAFFEVAKTDNAEAFLGMSSDVLMPPCAVETILNLYCEQDIDIALFARLPSVGSKKWEFVVTSDRLVDIKIAASNTSFERLLFIVRRETLEVLFARFGFLDVPELLPTELQQFQSGWTLLLKCILYCGIPIFSRIVDIPVHNINAPHDIVAANDFLRLHIPELYPCLAS